MLVLDLNMPGEQSLPAIPIIREESPATRVVVLTMQDDPAFAREALQAGASAYVLKEAADEELVQAVRVVASGGTFLRRSSAPASPRRRRSRPARRTTSPSARWRSCG